MPHLDSDDIPKIALDWIGMGHKVALATVVETWGSAPRPVGAQLAISDDSQIAGSVSGGCVEAAVVTEAIDALEDGRVRILEYGVSDDQAFAVGLACGGTIRVMVEPIGVGDGPTFALLEQLVTARQNRQPVALIVDTLTWERHLATPTDAQFPTQSPPNFASDKSGFSGEWFTGIHNPPLRMIVVGAVHIAQSLVPMARMAGYDVILVDPRSAFASENRFPDQDIRHDWSDAALRDIGLDARSCVVTLSHDPKIDDPAIHEALNSDVFYLGCLGSRKTHAKRVDRLHATGFSADQIARIHAPVGLDIGAATPAEIAISVLAQITGRLRN